MTADVNPLSRRLTSRCLIAAPTILLAGLALTPYQPHAGTRSYQDTLAAHPLQTQIAALLVHIGYVVLVPAVFGLIAYTRPAPRWLRAPGAVLAVIGTASLPGLLALDLYDLALAQKLPRGLSVAVADHAANSWSAVVMSSPAVFGTIVGTTLLVAAAWRAGLAPAWAAPLVLASFIIGHTPALLPALIGGGLLLVAYGSVGMRLVTATPSTDTADHNNTISATAYGSVR